MQKLSQLYKNPTSHPLIEMDTRNQLAYLPYLQHYMIYLLRLYTANIKQRTPTFRYTVSDPNIASF